MNKECICFARDAMVYDPEFYQWCGGVLFGIWPACPVHGDRFVSATWTREFGQHTRESAADETALVERN